MYTRVLNGYLNIVAQAVSSPTPISAEQLASLRAEITNDPTVRGYANKTAAQIIVLGSVEYYINNPTGQQRIDRPIVNGATFYTALVDADIVEKLADLPDSTPVPAGVPATTTPIVLRRQIEELRVKREVDPGKARTKAILSACVAYGLCNQATSRNILTYLDPNWTNQLLMPPRWEALFGAGALPELSDIEAALGV